MKTIKLNSLTLKNFKGVKKRTIEFSNQTFIYGKNGAGKTTVFDAFSWLINDKDSTGRKDFEIKTLDENGVAIPQIDHEVCAILTVDDEEIEIRKVYSEKWTKKRGAAEPEFTGHETNYFWNGVPMRQKDYQDNIAEICEEYIFKIITSPDAFNNLHWEKRRGILLEMAGEISDNDIAGDNPQYQKVVAELAKVKSEDDYKAKLNASVKKQREELKTIPSRIDEVEKSKIIDIPFTRIKEEIGIKEAALREIDTQLEDSSEALKAQMKLINDHNRKINAVQIKLDDIEFQAKRKARQEQNEENADVSELNTEIQGLQTKLNNLNSRRQTLSTSLTTARVTVSNIDAEMTKKREEWHKINSEEYHGDHNCPTCKQHLPEDMIEGMTEKFNAHKKEKLSNITTYGQKMKAEKEAYEKRIVEITAEILKIKEEVKQLENTIEGLEDVKALKISAKQDQPKLSLEQITSQILSKNAEYQSLKAEKKQLEDSVPEQQSIDNSELKAKKQAVVQELDKLKVEYAKKDQNKKADERIKQLKERQKELSQEITVVEGDLFALEEFMKLKVEEIERRVRDKFQFVSFRMFKEQINGGLKPTCETLVNGVPFSDVNTAGRINAGLDIINTLSKFYGVTAPVFLDNRESVVKILPTNAQIINLIVSPSDEALRIEHAKSNSQLPIFN